MKYGYGRVSTASQDLELQMQTLESEGCDRIYSEKFTGTRADRPQFVELLSLLKKGDTLVVTKLDRFARSAEDGVNLIKELLSKGIEVHILNMGLVEEHTRAYSFGTRARYESSCRNFVGFLDEEFKLKTCGIYKLNM